jgi:hypothetical protein
MSETVEADGPPDLENRSREYSLEVFQHLRGGGFTHPQWATLFLEKLLKLLRHPLRVTP